jgi:hypothetical protein
MVPGALRSARIANCHDVSNAGQFGKLEAMLVCSHEALF